MKISTTTSTACRDRKIVEPIRSHYVLRFVLSSLLVLTATAAGIAEQPTERSLEGEKFAKILFLGNSLTLHGPKPDIGWNGNWGMAASAQDQDFVHLVTAMLNHDAKVVPAKIGSDELPETEDHILNIASIVEREYASYDRSKLKKQLDLKPEIVIIQCGENVPSKRFDPIAFERGFKLLLDDIKETSNPMIFVTSTILSGRPAIDEIKRKVCDEDKAHRIYIDFADFQQAKDVIGFAGHPNDKGMKLIAEKLYEVVEEKLRKQ